MNRRAFLIGSVASALITSKALAQTTKTAFIFVGASWCPVCHRAAPVLARIAIQSGTPVLVASADGRPIAPFERFVSTQDHPIANAVTAYPTTLVYSGNSKQLVATIEGYRQPNWYTHQLVNAIAQVERGGI